MEKSAVCAVTPLQQPETAVHGKLEYGLAYKLVSWAEINYSFINDF